MSLDRVPNSSPALFRGSRLRDSCSTALLLHIYCIYDSDMTHGGHRSHIGIIGVQRQCHQSYLGYINLIFCYEGQCN
jgi:hypothetical protein